MTYYVLVALSRVGIVWDLKVPPKQVLRNEQRLGSRVIRRTAEQLAGRFNPEYIALAIKSSVHEAGLSVRDALLRLQNSADWHLPSMPTRDQLLAEAQAMFAKTKSLDDIVDRAHELLVKSVSVLLAVPPGAESKSQSKVAFVSGHPHIRSMNWQRSSPREPSRTKAELRQMLTEAVRNTPNPNQQSKRLTKAKKIPADAACVD